MSMVSMRCSSCAVGYVMTAFIMKRSICASGRLNVPSSSIGFCVAMTMNGFGSAMHWPPMVVAPSAMASSMADWVFAFERLISSSSTKLAWIGPICVENFCVAKSKTWVPTRSDGIRSGVHCTRLNDPDTEVASVCAAVVLARPGTDSMRICPPATSVVISDSRRLSCPTRVCAKRARMHVPSCFARLMSSGGNVLGLVTAGIGTGVGVGTGFFGGNKAIVATVTGQADGRDQSTGFSPAAMSAWLARENGFEPKNPYRADIGLG